MSSGQVLLGPIGTPSPPPPPQGTNFGFDASCNLCDPYIVAVKLKPHSPRIRDQDLSEYQLIIYLYLIRLAKSIRKIINFRLVDQIDY